MGAPDSPTKLLLVNRCSPGDVLMLTAAVRDLHQAYPSEYITAVETACPDLWLSNPYITPLAPASPGVRRIDCHHPPMLDRCNRRPRHYIESVHDLLSRKLGRPIPLTRFAPDVHLWAEEKRRPPHRLLRPYWVMVAGGKYDVTVKWWPRRYFQEVADRFAGRIQFVQVGGSDHHHPLLRGVVNLVGKTSLRELVQLVYHADGVVCPITCTMHLAAAFDKPCVVVAGGREPPHWEMYPGHQFLHTVGQLPCCAGGGCWKARMEPLGDGDQERNGNLCLSPTRINDEPVAECMAMIEPSDVCRAIAGYVRPPSCRGGVPVWDQGDLALDEDNCLVELNRTVEYLRGFPYPSGEFKGRGIVVCGGGDRYLPCVWVCVNAVRACGCELPIQVWHLGEGEMDDCMRGLLRPLGVEAVDAWEVRKEHPVRRLNGWEVKPFSILHCPFEEVILLDADNVPIIDPAVLFATAEYADHGAIFWPDYGWLRPGRSIWKVMGLEPRGEREVESGQIVVDKRRCWGPLLLTMWLNEHSDFFYRHVHGDKETFHMAWRKLGRDYAMPAGEVYSLAHCTMCQHDFQGRRIFQHRNSAKWRLRDNRRVRGFEHERECLAYLRALAERWSGHVGVPLTPSPEEQALAEEVAGTRLFDYVRVGYDRRPMELLDDHRIGQGRARCEREWWITTVEQALALSIYGQEGLTCRLFRDGDRIWRGRWQRHEQMPVELVPRKQ